MFFCVRFGRSSDPFCSLLVDDQATSFGPRPPNTGRPPQPRCQRTVELCASVHTSTHQTFRCRSGMGWSAASGGFKLTVPNNGGLLCGASAVAGWPRDLKHLQHTSTQQPATPSAERAEPFRRPGDESGIGLPNPTDIRQPPPQARGAAPLFPTLQNKRASKAM